MESTKTSSPDDSGLSRSDESRTPASKIRVLCAGQSDIVRAQFASEAPQIRLLTSEEASVALTGTSKAAIDVAFVDCGAPGLNAAAWLADLRLRRVDIPVVVAIDPGAEDAARLAADLRADDYTVKSPGWLSRLPARLGIAVTRHRSLSRFETIRANEQRLRSIVESAPVCFTRVDRSATILAMNAAARAMVGAAAPADVLRKSLLSFISDGDRAACERAIELACGDQAGSLEFTLCAPPGASSRQVAASTHPVPASPGVAATAVLVLRDVSAVKSLEESIEARAEAERTARESAEAERREREKADAERHAHELAEAERCARESAEAEHRKRETAEAERHARELTEAENRARKSAEAERRKREKAEADRHARELADAERRVREAAEGERRERESAQAEELARERQKNRQRLDELQEQCRELRAERDRLQSGTRHAREATRMLTGRLKKQEVTRRKAEADRDGLKRALEQRRPEYETEIATMSAARDELTQRVAAIETEKARFESELAAALDACADLERQLGSAGGLAQQRVSELESRLVEETATRLELELRLQRAEAEVSELKAANEETWQRVSECLEVARVELEHVAQLARRQSADPQAREMSS